MEKRRERDKGTKRMAKMVKDEEMEEIIISVEFQRTFAPAKWTYCADLSKAQGSSS
jgi:hypothetical protein